LTLSRFNVIALYPQKNYCKRYLSIYNVYINKLKINFIVSTIYILGKIKIINKNEKHLNNNNRLDGFLPSILYRNRETRAPRVSSMARTSQRLPAILLYIMAKRTM